MKKLYEKNELTFAIVWIVVYCVLQSRSDSYTLILTRTIPKSQWKEGCKYE